MSLTAIMMLSGALLVAIDRIYAQVEIIRIQRCVIRMYERHNSEKAPSAGPYR